MGKSDFTCCTKVFLESYKRRSGFVVSGALKLILFLFCELMDVQNDSLIEPIHVIAPSWFGIGAWFVISKYQH